MRMNLESVKQEEKLQETFSRLEKVRVLAILAKNKR